MPSYTRDTTTTMSNAVTAQDFAVTPEEAAFCDLLMLNLPPKEAAARAGIGSYSKALRKPGVRALLRDRQAIEAEALVPVSFSTLRDVMTNPVYPGAAKVSAVKLVWSAVGLLRTGAKSAELRAPDPSIPEPKGVAAPSDEGLEQNLQRMRAMLDEMHARLTAAEPIDVTPEPTPRASSPSSPIDL